MSVSRAMAQAETTVLEPSLDIRAAEPTTEIFVIDGDMYLVDRGVGQLQTKPLHPGIYKIKARAGAETREQHVVVERPQQVVELEPFHFASPAPLDDTSRTHEYHIAAAQAVSRQPGVPIGTGSSLFVLAREWTPRGSPARKNRALNPALGLTLLDDAGTKLVDIASAATKDDKEIDPWAACNIALAAGPYRLAVESPTGRLEQTVIACDGWQTQVFLPMADVAGERRADGAGASILMARGQGFTAGDRELWFAELARVGLANRRKCLSTEIRKMLADKFQNPMLGIYGAHLLLLEAEPDVALLRVVVGNLRAMLGSNHPDVEAVALACGEPTTHIFRSLPMLRRSWTIVIEQTLQRPELVPADTVAAKLASRLCAADPWLLAASSEVSDDDDEQPGTALDFAVQMQMQLAPKESNARTDSPFGAVRKLREQRRAAGRKRSLAPMSAIVMSDALPAEASQVSRLVRTLGIPRATAEQLVNRGISQPAPAVVTPRTGPSANHTPRRTSMANQDQWCFAWLQPKQAAEGADRAAMVKGAMWKKNEVIPVAFLDGDAGVQAKVKKAAQGWTAPGMANLSFDFINNPNNALIRISFTRPGSWSTVGTTCRQVTNKAQPTMNYGWLTPQSTDEEVQRVVLHEFGHALGLVHEHQNPAGGIKWNRDAVIRDLSGPPNSWPLDVIEHNMFEPQAKAETNFTSLDPKSIMMYPIPARWTLDGFSVGLNSALSDTDKKFIKQQY